MSTIVKAISCSPQTNAKVLFQKTILTQHIKHGKSEILHLLIRDNDIGNDITTEET